MQVPEITPSWMYVCVCVSVYVCERACMCPYVLVVGRFLFLSAKGQFELAVCLHRIVRHDIASAVLLNTETH